MAKRRRRKRIKLGTVLLVCFLIWLGYTFGKGFVRHYHLKQKIARLRHEIQAFELRNAEIRRQIEHYRSYEYIERVAREELGLVKPGETRFIISESKDE
ncbi:MAG: septum formation initiator family protein [Limnochordia bacterium]|jgi:cell division protein DivIC|nr:septum formation initiator family protein [Bacillota bacterium]HOB08269.1 septum formation initiator family protein [Limnochordia bacterium]NLH30560.1 septum formation initiator family protein [Bacillota bacterium]HPT92553.1 septum formation initiator family protein [Limnochordia bacterium]HPZ30510.1 septum formation initiator family protein [Limnochordia bacterium]